MKDWASIKERYIRDNLQIRLGGLAANLARIASFSDHPDHRDVVESLLEESKWFIEWSASEAAIETQAELARLQITLALWQLRLDRDWRDESTRHEMATAAKRFSETVLSVSGLLQMKQPTAAI